MPIPRTPTPVRMPPELKAELDEWCASQRPPAQRTAAICLAIREFLDREKAAGWKPPTAPGKGKKGGG